MEKTRHHNMNCIRHWLMAVTAVSSMLAVEVASAQRVMQRPARAQSTIWHKVKPIPHDNVATQAELVPSDNASARAKKIPAKRQAAPASAAKKKSYIRRTLAIESWDEVEEPTSEVWSQLTQTERSTVMKRFEQMRAEQAETEAARRLVKKMEQRIIGNIRDRGYKDVTQSSAQRSLDPLWDTLAAADFSAELKKLVGLALSRGRGSFLDSLPQSIIWSLVETIEARIRGELPRQARSVEETHLVHALMLEAQQSGRHLLYKLALLDPYTVSLRGFDGDESVALEAQEPSASLNILPTFGKFGGKMLRDAMAHALRFKEFKRIGLLEFEAVEGIDGVSLAQKTIPERLEVHAPVRAVAYKQGKRAGESGVVNVRGRLDQVGLVDAPGGTPKAFRSGGTVQAHYQPWLNVSNIFVTPPLANNGALSQAHFTALAAFPMGAEVAIANLSTGATFEGKASTLTGSISGYLPGAQPGTRFKITVTFPGQAGASKTTSTFATFALPEKQSAEPTYAPIALVK